MRNWQIAHPKFVTQVRNRYTMNNESVHQKPVWSILYLYSHQINDDSEKKNFRSQYACITKLVTSAIVIRQSSRKAVSAENRWYPNLQDMLPTLTPSGTPQKRGQIRSSLTDYFPLLVAFSQTSSYSLSWNDKKRLKNYLKFFKYCILCWTSKRSTLRDRWNKENVWSQQALSPYSVAEF